MKRTILDFGAGYQAIHTFTLREAGLDVTAWDFGRNFDPSIHDKAALSRQYDVVMASNVVNVHGTINAFLLTLRQITGAVKPGGYAMINYPDSPRKMPWLSSEMFEAYLCNFFKGVYRQGRNVYLCNQPVTLGYTPAEFTLEEITAANIRPVGAVGRNALVPRLVLDRETLLPVDERI